jgi:hypothetical protein
MRDLYSNIKAEVALAPADQAASITGAAIDTQDADAIAFIVSTGAITGAGAFGVKLQESDTTNSGDFTDADASIVDSNAPATLAASAVYKLGYRGFKRYARVALTKASGTSIVAGAVAVKDPLNYPAA